MKSRVLVFLILASVGCLFASDTFAQSTRKERRLINKGNDLYKESRFVEAQSNFEEALRENPSSAEARYNLGLSQIRQISNLSDTTAKNKARIDMAKKNFSDVAALAKTKPGLAAKANLNLGNIEFKAKDFQKAIDYYKQALRIDPSDDKVRKNLRIAQLNLKKQNQDKNKDKDQNQDKNQDKNKDQNKDQEKNKDRREDQNKDRNKDNKEQKQNNLSQQTASQILQAVDNKESATRARVSKGNGKKESASGRNNRRW